MLEVCFTVCFLVGLVNEKSSLDCPYKNFWSLQQEDKQLAETTHELFQALQENPEVYFPSYYTLSGSIKEGSSSARLFLRNNEFLDNINRQFEVDIESTILEMSAEYKRCVEDISGKPGFVRIFFDNIKCNCKTCTVNGSQKDIQTIKDSSGYGRPFYLKQIHFDLHNMSRYKGDTSYQILFAILYNLPFDAVHITLPERNITKATFNMTFSLLVEDKLEFKFTTDNAYLIKLNWVSDSLKNWIKTKQAWPPLHMLTDEIQTSYLIAKSSKEEKSNMETTEWRYSFSRLEHKLVRLHSEEQRMVYILFKSIFYTWLKPMDPENLSSFLVKTIMFWVCGRYPPDSGYWRNDARSISRVLRQLFVSLRTAFKRNFLSYYFIPEINVVKHIPFATKQRVCVLLQRIALDLESFIPRKNMDDIIEVVYNWRMLSNSVKFFAEKARNAEEVMQQLFLKRPDLLFHVKGSLHDMLYNDVRSQT